MNREADTPEPDDEGLRRALSALLREPVDVDPTARDAAIRAALDAAGTDTAGTTSAVTPLRRRGPRSAPPGRTAGDGARRPVLRPGLVAAATVILLAGGAFAAIQGTGSNTSDEQATSGAADAGAEHDSTSAEEGRAAGPTGVLDPSTPPGGSQDGATADEDHATTTVARPEPADEVRDLGEFPDTTSLLEVAERSLDQAGPDDMADGDPSTPTPLIRCLGELPGRDLTPVASATVDDVRVLVAQDDSGTLRVVDRTSCAVTGGQ